MTLTINLSALAAIASPPVVVTPPGEDTKQRQPRLAVVSAEVLAETLDRYDGCRCNELGLEEGMPVRDLVYLGSGCTGETMDGRRLRKHNQQGWVCQRLDLVRRRYGK